MTHPEQNNNNSIAPLRNVAALRALIERIRNRSLALPGMGTFYGPSGFGKSSAAVHATTTFRAVTVQVKSVWTKKKLCEAICAELSIHPAKTTGDMVDQISERLAITDQPLLIDEADFLVTKSMIEVVRDIYEGSGAPVILIGEENLPQKLRVWERVHGRMLEWVAAEPADISDVAHLAAIYAPGLTIERGLQDIVLMASQRSIRRICVNLDQIREYAALKGKDTVSVADWGTRGFFTGEAPVGRSFAPLRKRGAV